MKKAYTVLEQGIKIGLIGGVSAVLLALIGMVEAFSQRDIISNVISMGHTLLLLVRRVYGLSCSETDRLDLGRCGSLPTASSAV